MHDPLVVAHEIPSPIPHRVRWKDKSSYARRWGFVRLRRTNAENLGEPVYRWFGGTTRYHPACCPACVPDVRVDRGVPEPALVERMKRGHRRGTPRAWAMRGAGG